MEKIGIILPTRGLVFAEVEEYIENVRSSYPAIRVFRSHNLAIPECLNTLVTQALEDKEIKYLWMIEEDTVPPDLALDRFLENVKLYDVMAVDYGFNGGHNTIVKSSLTDEILFTGFGCTFIKRQVFDKLDKPYFRADRAFNISNMQWYAVDALRVYGMHDIDFASRVRAAGFTIGQIEGECRHLQLLELGQKEINNGCHIIGEKDKISKPLTLAIVDL